MPNRGRPLVVIAGSVAQRPNRGGHAWVFLQYVLGFRRLGWDVLFLDRLTDDMLPSEDDALQPVVSIQPRVDWFLKVMRRGAVGDGYSLALPGGRRLGLDRAEVLRRIRRSSFLLDVNGFLADEEISAAAPVRVFLDIDPGFNQMWHELGLVNVFDGYDAFVTIAQRIGKADCLIPTCGRSWITTVPPVVLDEWPVMPPTPEAPITTVATWRGPFDPVEYAGTRFGLRAHEFRALADLPTISGERFQIALDIDEADDADRQMLLGRGWEILDPSAVASELNDYRDFIQGSKAEFAAAKEMYVKTRSGWISDRSVCYLASGRPVVMQHTGSLDHIPSKHGLWSYSSLEEGAATVSQVAGDYPRQAARARKLAASQFGSDVVLSAMASRIGAHAGCEMASSGAQF